MDVYKEEKNQKLWIFLSFAGLITILICTITLCVLVLLLPTGGGTWDAGQYQDGVWSGVGPTQKDLQDWYPKRFGLYNVWYVEVSLTDNRVGPLYKINAEAIASIIMLGLVTINLLIIIVFARPKIKAWFKISAFNRISVILEIACIVLLIIGLAGKPTSGVDPLNEQWQQGKDVDWANIIFRHDPYMDTTWGASQAEATGKMYHYTVVGIVTLIFTLIVLIWCIFDTIFATILTVNRYRSWKRYKTIDVI